MDEDKLEMYEDVESSSSETANFLPNPDIRHTRRLNQLGLLKKMRIVLEVLLLALLAFLLISGSTHSAEIPRYGPTLPRKNVILGNAANLGPPIEYNNHEMLWNQTEMNRIHRNWQQLFPKGRGYVKVGQDGEEDFRVLHPPFAMDDVLVRGDHYEGHIMAVYHQLHCLSIMATSMGTSREEWHDMNERIREHRSHCIEYLRQSILCNADTTLEGETGSWTKSTGWGQTHSCVDFDALTDYANEKAIWDLTEELLPENFDFKKADVEGKPRSEVDESKFTD